MHTTPCSHTCVQGVLCYFGLVSSDLGRGVKGWHITWRGVIDGDVYGCSCDAPIWRGSGIVVCQAACQCVCSNHV